MKRNLTLISTAAVLLAAIAYFTNEGWIYTVITILAVVVMSVIRQFPKLVTSFTRWAKQNPFKTQVLITVLQLIILSVGLILGYNLKQLGYNFSKGPLFVFAILLSVGFAIVPFVQRKRIIALPVNLNRDRFAYMTIALSAFAIMVVTGNRIESSHPNSVFSRALKSVDRSMFSEVRFAEEQEATSTEESFFQESPFASIAVNGGSSIHPGKELPANNKTLKKAKRFEKKLARHKEKIMKRIEALRKAVSGWATAGVVFLVILLIVAACAGVCLALMGGGAGAVIGGIALLALSIWGIVKLVSPRKPKEPNPPKSET